MSIASSAPTSPCSRRRTIWSSASSARGIFSPTKSWRMRSSMFCDRSKDALTLGPPAARRRDTAS